MKSYKPIKQFEGYSENPFIEAMLESVTPVKKVQWMKPANDKEVQLIVSQKSGELQGHSAFLRYIEVDEDKFAKIYLSQFASLFDLPKTSIRVFGYVLSVVKPNQDQLIFDMEDCKKYTEYKTEKSVLEGLVGLIENGIIARSNKHYKYFINPLVVFNGNRVTFAKTYIKKRKGINENQLEIGFTDSLRE